MGYLLVFPEAVIKTLHWEYEENHCVVQKTSHLHEGRRLFDLCLKIMIAQVWKTFLIEYQGTETCLIVYFKDALNGPTA